ncbi:MAG: phosphoribosylformylglycinamidine synthase, partial [Clostridiales bacterium]|nr:phosphoribosylformylglycinamidine synthase [Clostridiales bacterium]
MVYRVFVEKKPEEALESKALAGDLRSFLGIDSLEGLRIVNRYDVENISPELFSRCITTIFSEPQLDIVSDELRDTEGAKVFAVEFLPGQFDQRADSAEQCIQFVSMGERPCVRSAKVYVIYGNISEDELDEIKRYIVNPVECRLASMEVPKTLNINYVNSSTIAFIDGFCNMDLKELLVFLNSYSLSMEMDDLVFCQNYFKEEGREPTLTEIKLIDTYWSDHCRHTTFNTIIDSVSFEDKTIGEAWDRYLALREKLSRTKPICLMDIATIVASQLKAEGKLCKLDESEEINACTVKIDVKTEAGVEKWLLLFKNETHNHPTEIEPFGGAATCIGGAIRDPLSGRAYVYAAMRISGASDPTVDISETLEGKLPQRKLVSTAAAGYSSYGNQIGVATGMVEEIYHSGYAAKHMELGAVIAAAPKENVRREKPESGDLVLLIGGRTGRDGCGGATGSSKAHDLTSLETCGAEVQKGNAPEERKIQRLFRNPEAARLIKRCNDFGAGGVSVAIGELADGLEIDLDLVPKKYEGLDGTELAISESQERMAVVINKNYVNRFLELAESENLEATVVAKVTESPRMVMLWKGQTIADLSREFLDSGGAKKHINIAAATPMDFEKALPSDFETGMRETLSDLNVCSKQGLSERFDSTIGAGSVLMPFGGKNQKTPIQAMVHKISREKGDTSTCSFMSWGFNPKISEKSPYHGAYLAVVESISKLIAAGCPYKDLYLSLQEYFEKPLDDPKRWGKPLSALLGAFAAQQDLGVAAIGGKDSMSGSFEKLDVPPTLVSFAVGTGDIENVLSPEFKETGSYVCLLEPEYNDGLPVSSSLIKNFETIAELNTAGKLRAVYTPTYGAVAEAIFKMCIGNGLGFCYDEAIGLTTLFSHRYGSFILELSDCEPVGLLLGKTQKLPEISFDKTKLCIKELMKIYVGRLEGVYPSKTPESKLPCPSFDYFSKTQLKPRKPFAR